MGEAARRGTEGERKQEALANTDMMVIQSTPGMVGEDDKWVADPDKWEPLMGFDLPGWVKAGEVISKLRQGKSVCFDANANGRWYRGFVEKRSVLEELPKQAAEPKIIVEA